METILIIEDDISILRGLKDNLEYEGYTVITETNGTNADGSPLWRASTNWRDYFAAKSGA